MDKSILTLGIHCAILNSTKLIRILKIQPPATPKSVSEEGTTCELLVPPRVKRENLLALL